MFIVFSSSFYVQEVLRCRTLANLGVSMFFYLVGLLGTFLVGFLFLFLAFIYYLSYIVKYSPSLNCLPKVRVIITFKSKMSNTGMKMYAFVIKTHYNDISQMNN
jgi:hypothetical protein